ncbi:hypothetical protein MIND_00833700 [Mycena indigotica]|uniref:PIG-U-domain-containing protein n=1 Tax=Mycena indigotica TaxID=2126181 RepID=A0A8H6VYI5_9AGAR|nr:uncharacterized protein MIND_00833700 [Mycena indigotica]KAF7298859.1 hypothetical protein MIND_00833700 [Mycena indigotica]
MLRVTALRMAKSTTLTLPALAGCRIALALATDLYDTLKHNHQLASPLTSYLNLQEGVFLFKNGVNPYSGGVFRHSPILLSLFTTVIPTSRRLASILWTLSDIAGAWALVQLWRARQRAPQTSRDGLVAAAYLLNPYLFLPTLALSSSTFENTLTLLSLMFAAQGNASLALVSAAILLHLSLPSILLSAPLILLLSSSNGPLSQLASPRAFTPNDKKWIALLGEYVAYAVFLSVISTLVSGGLSWIPQTWGANITLPDLTPNVGVWWYFFTEMFDHFRPFFLMVFSVHLIIYVAPLCIKFQYDPLYAAFVLLGVLGTFKAYPTMADIGLFASMFAVFPELFPYLRHPIVTILLHLHAALLMPLFHHLWLSQGTANANFFYATTLVFACANGAALTDCIWAGLRIAIGAPEEGFSVVQE